MIKKTDKYKTCQKSAYVRGRRKEKTKKKLIMKYCFPQVLVSLRSSLQQDSD